MNWQRIDDLYRIRQVSNDLKPAFDHCGMCYQAECTHKSIERVSYETSKIHLNTWVEVALQEYPGTYLDIGDAIYPSWPTSQELFNPNIEFIPYRVYPKIKGAIFGGIVAHDVVIGYNVDLTPNVELTKIGEKVARFGTGMYWGYGFNGEFYVLRLFRQKWQEIRRKSLPHKDVVGLTVPEFDVPFEIEGYHFIPLQSSLNVDFQQKYFEL